MLRDASANARLLGALRALLGVRAKQGAQVRQGEGRGRKTKIRWDENCPSEYGLKGELTESFGCREISLCARCRSILCERCWDEVMAAAYEKEAKAKDRSARRDDAEIGRRSEQG